MNLKFVLKRLIVRPIFCTIPSEFIPGSIVKFGVNI